MKLSKKATVLLGIQTIPVFTPMMASADAVSDVVTKAQNAGLTVDIEDKIVHVKSKAEADRLNAEQASKISADAAEISNKIDEYIRNKKDVATHNTTIINSRDKEVEGERDRVKRILEENDKIAKDNALAQQDYLKRLHDVKAANAKKMQDYNDAVARIRSDASADLTKWNDDVRRVRDENTKRIQDYQTAMVKYNADIVKISADLTNAGSSQGSANTAAARQQLDAIAQANNKYAQDLAKYQADMARITADNKRLQDKYDADKRAVDQANQQARDRAAADNARKAAAFQQALRDWDTAKQQAAASRQQWLNNYATQYRAAVTENDNIRRANVQKRRAWETGVDNARRRNQQIDQQNQASRDAYQRAQAQYQQDIQNIRNRPVFKQAGQFTIYGGYNQAGAGSGAYFNNFAMASDTYTGETLAEPVEFHSHSRISNVQGMQDDVRDGGSVHYFKNVTNGASVDISNVSRTMSGEAVHVRVTVVDTGRSFWREGTKELQLNHENGAFGWMVFGFDKVSLRFSFYTDSGRTLNIPMMLAVSDIDWDQGSRVSYSGGTIMTDSPDPVLSYDGSTYWDTQYRNLGDPNGQNDWLSVPQGSMISAGTGDVTYTHYATRSLHSLSGEALISAAEAEGKSGYFFALFGRNAWLKTTIKPKPPVDIPHVEEPPQPSYDPLKPLPEPPSDLVEVPPTPLQEPPTVADVTPLPPKPPLTPPADVPPKPNIPEFPPHVPGTPNYKQPDPPKLTLLPEPPKPTIDGLEPPEPDMVPEPKAPKPKPAIPIRKRDTEPINLKEDPDKPVLKLKKVQYLYANRTIWETVDGKVLKSWHDGELPREEFDGYDFVKTIKDNDGNTHHIYKPKSKVTTIWVTIDGKVLKPRTPGELPPEDFDGYVFVRTEKDKDGNLTHIYKPYKKVTTIWVTTDGKVLKPRTPGELPPEDFDGYVFVRTEKDKDGNLKHIYKPKTQVNTIWVTTDGKVLKPRTPGELPPEDFDGYVFVRTEKDKDGNLKHIYKPYDKVNTIWVTIDGQVLKPRTPGELPPEDFDGYVFVRTEKDKDGNLKHIYKPYDKITTIWITEDGKVLKPRTPGEHPKEDFDGYEFVRTEKDDKGNIRHIYKPKSQVNTIWITEDGKVLKPRTPGEHPKEDFDGYEFVRTERDKDGNLKHIYKPKSQVTTVWVTEDGNVLKPRTPGEHPKEDFDGYEFVRTEKDDKGNIRHIYRPKSQVNTIWITEDGKVLKPQTPGEHPKEDFDGYEYVRTEKDDKGNIRHIYRPKAIKPKELPKAGDSSVGLLGAILGSLGFGLKYKKKHKKHQKAAR